MAQTHYFPVGIGRNQSSRAHWAREPSGDLIVFVHGFGGDAVRSWVEFPTMVSTRDPAARADIIYFGYDGLRTRIYVSAVQLLTLLKSLNADPVKFISKSRGHKTAHADGFEYKRIILIAHSMGAILCRRMLLAGRNEKLPWLGDVSLILFAPAHCGAQVYQLVTGVLGAIGLPLIAPLASWRFPILYDAPHDCTTITSLLDETTKALDAGGAEYLRPKLVAIPEHDAVVHSAAFYGDPGAKIIYGTNHSTVCKPSATRPDPVDLVVGALS